MENNAYKHLKMVIMNHHADPERGWEQTQLKILRAQRAKKARFWGAAASVAAIIIISIFIFNPQMSVGDNSNLVSANPGKNQAILIMSDGSKVTLSDSSDLKLTDVSGAEISIEDGKNIQYKNVPAELEKIAVNTIVVPRAGIYSVTLSDGTKVWINSDSKLSYPVSFTGEKREVTLTTGEAFFVVAHDKNHPFIVNCNGNSVTVTGTEFNVESYDTNRTITTLVKGGVILSGSSGSVNLTPGMQGIIAKNEIITLNVNAQQYSSWKDGFFEFDNMTLGEMLTKLSRWYDVEFKFTNSELANLTFTATFPKDENLSFIVKLIERISSARFVTSEDKVVVYSKE